MIPSPAIYLPLLQDKSQGPGFGNLLIPLVLMFVIFYFLLIRPQRKEQKRQAAMRETLKKGDRVLTQGGIIAKVQGVRDNEVTLDLDGNSRMKVVKESVVRRLDEQPAEGGQGS